MDTRRKQNSRLRVLGELYLAALTNTRELSVEIEQEVEAAKEAGTSLAAISETSGLSVPQIEYILASVHVQQQLADYSISRWGDTAIPHPGAGQREDSLTPKRLAQ